jgi:PKD repeat protein
VGIGAVLASLVVAAVPPTGDFTVTPATPVAGQPAVFTATAADPEGGPLGLAWDLDGDGQATDAAGPTVTTTYPTPGRRRVRLDVTDAEGVTTSVTRPVDVDAPPTAAITWAPAAPTVDDLVALRANEADPDGTVTAVAWDTNADGLFADPPALRFPRPGAYRVAARVTDDDGATIVAHAIVEVVNRPPWAGFGHLPLAPRRRQRVTFTSTSVDPDGGALAHAWDLDGDGAYDDAEGPVATRRFRTARPRTVGLLVTDEQGASATAFATVTVARRSAPPLSPFPVVRLAGRVVDDGARVRRLTVHAPRGSVVDVTCRGGGCPFAVQQHTATSSRRPVRVHALERRRLHAGAVLVVRVGSATRTGKYTRFRVRDGRAPARIDRCLPPGERTPVRCPGT